MLLSSCSILGFEFSPEATSTPFVSPRVVVGSDINPFLSPLAEPIIIKDTSIAKGRAVVKGRLFSTKTNAPLVNAVVRLAEVYYANDAQAAEKSGGVYALDNAFSPSAFTDVDGNFVFTDIEARDYVLIVGDIFGTWALALDESQEKPTVWSAIERSVTDIGAVHIDY